jgi:hypothetical protein
LQVYLFSFGSMSHSRYREQKQTPFLRYPRRSLKIEKPRKCLVLIRRAFVACPGYAALTIVKEASCLD